MTPEQSLLPAPELTSQPVIVEEEQGAAGNQHKSNMVSLADFDLIKVIGRGSYAKVGLCYFRSFCSFFSFSSFCFLLIAPCSLPIAPRSGVDGGAEVHEEDFRHEGDQEGSEDG